MKNKPSRRDSAPVDLPLRPPKLPQDVVDRFPGLALWEDQWMEIWETMVQNLKSRDTETQSRLTKLEE